MTKQKDLKFIAHKIEIAKALKVNISASITAENITEGNESKLNSIIHVRLKAINMLEFCTRCGGSGHYSYNQRDGSMCFKCQGHRYQLPSKSKMNTKKFLNEIVKRVEAGGLDEYFKEIEFKNRINKASKTLFDLMQNNQNASDYDKEYRNKELDLIENRNIKETRFRICDIHKNFTREETKVCSYRINLGKGGKGFTEEGLKEKEVELMELFEKSKAEMEKVIKEYDDSKNK